MPEYYKCLNEYTVSRKNYCNEDCLITQLPMGNCNTPLFNRPGETRSGGLFCPARWSFDHPDTCWFFENSLYSSCSPLKATFSRWQHQIDTFIFFLFQVERHLVNQNSFYFTEDMQEAVQKRRVLQRNWKRSMLAKVGSMLWKNS